MNYLKSVLFLFLLLSVCKAQGQFMNKGDLLIGGNGNINGGSLGLGYFSIGDWIYSLITSMQRMISLTPRSI